ncbi:MAG: cytochrome c, partial [Planctomycetes bacterium]|nr:cytochrome c [Planctomycetota bacterium]
AALGLLLPTLAFSQQDIPLSSRATPKGTAVAETQLLMEAIAHSNFKGLEKMLKGKPEDADAWNFARGRALLIAETGNLLLLRPPKNLGAEIWNKSSIEMRESATRLARAAAAQDLNTSRSRLIEVSNACNKCHQSFRVATRLSPFREDMKPTPLPPQ